MRKRDGDRTEPCFTPRLMQKGVDKLFLYLTQLVGKWYHDLISLPFIAAEYRCCSRIGNSKLSLCHRNRGKDCHLVEYS